MIINPRTEEAYQLFHNGILALARAEQQGIRIDLDYVDKKIRFLNRKVDRLEEEFKETSFFRHWQHSSKRTVNIYSNEQLASFLYNVKGMRIEKETATGKGATDDDALIQMNIPALNVLLQAKKLKTVKEKYLKSFLREQVNGYIHPFFNLHLVVTYRGSSDHPNFQNMPKRDEESMQIVRGAVYPRPGHLILEADFKGIEVSVAACYHKDSNMLKYIRNPASDMHADMAKQIFMVDDFDKSQPSHYLLRQAAKNGFVFPQFYGDYYKNCANNMACTWGKLPKGSWKKGQGIEMESTFLSNHLISQGIKSLESFENYLKKIEKDFWFKRFPEYREWKERWWNIYQKYGYFTLLTGFSCSGIMDKRQVTNYPIQGTAFHCLLWALIKTDRIIRKMKLDTKIIGQIHDSLILDVHPDELTFIIKTIKRIINEDLPNTWKWIIVPMEVEMEKCPIDGSWALKENFKI